MGHGAARELGGAEAPSKVLPADLDAKVREALQKMDSLDQAFKDRRAEELYTQNVKLWNNVCKEIDSHLRSLAKTMIDSHQLSLDIGSDGGGASTKPFLEEMSLVFDKLIFKLVDGTEVHATYKEETFLKGGFEDAVSYDWVERAVAEWVLLAISQK